LLSNDGSSIRLEIPPFHFNSSLEGGKAYTTLYLPPLFILKIRIKLRKMKTEKEIKKEIKDTESILLGYKRNMSSDELLSYYWWLQALKWVLEDSKE